MIFFRLPIRPFFILAFFSLTISVNAQWTQINTRTNRTFKQLTFPSIQTAYALASDGGFSATFLYKSEDAGLTWREVMLNLDSITSPQLQDIFFVDELTGFMTLRSRIVRLKIFMLKTEDGGLNWTNITPDSLPAGYGNSSLYFTSSLNGFVASGGRLYHTSDGGNNWQTSLNLSWEGINEVHFHDSLNGIAGAWDGTFAYQGRIFTTADGGQSWDSLYIPENGSAIGNVLHVGDSTAFALGDQSWQGQSLYKTIDNGNSWDTLRLSFLADSSDSAVDLYFEDGRNGYLISSLGYIFRTYNGGQNWTQVHGKNPGLEDIASNSNTLFVCGPTNTLLTYPNTLGVSDEQEINKGFFYPNPCNRDEKVYFHKPLSGNLKILDLQGKLIYSEQVKRLESFSLANVALMPGIYVIQMVGKDKTHSNVCMIK